MMKKLSLLHGSNYFEKNKQTKWCWKKHPSYEDNLDVAGRKSPDLKQLVGESVFSKTYFALEEAGWGYPVFLWLTTARGNNWLSMTLCFAYWRMPIESHRPSTQQQKRAGMLQRM
jgi:hypothetical protein